ncbi:hypothetical protein DIPPA_33017 [Diplonema papillatum]|nr:hypothetical protein DIPPA_33017 [Diplonema papillatum]
MGSSASVAAGDGSQEPPAADAQLFALFAAGAEPCFWRLALPSVVGGLLSAGDGAGGADQGSLEVTLRAAYLTIHAGAVTAVLRDALVGALGTKAWARKQPGPADIARAMRAEVTAQALRASTRRKRAAARLSWDYRNCPAVASEGVTRPPTGGERAWGRHGGLGTGKPPSGEKEDRPSKASGGATQSPSDAALRAGVGVPLERITVTADGGLGPVAEPDTGVAVLSTPPGHAAFLPDLVCEMLFPSSLSLGRRASGAASCVEGLDSYTRRHGAEVRCLLARVLSAVLALRPASDDAAAATASALSLVSKASHARLPAAGPGGRRPRGVLPHLARFAHYFASPIAAAAARTAKGRGAPPPAPPEWRPASRCGLLLKPGPGAESAHLQCPFAETPAPAARLLPSAEPAVPKLGDLPDAPTTTFLAHPGRDGGPNPAGVACTSRAASVAPGGERPDFDWTAFFFSAFQVTKWIDPTDPTPPEWIHEPAGQSEGAASTASFDSRNIQEKKTLPVVEDVVPPVVQMYQIFAASVMERLYLVVLQDPSVEAHRVSEPSNTVGGTGEHTLYHFREDNLLFVMDHGAVGGKCWKSLDVVLKTLQAAADTAARLEPPSLISSQPAMLVTWIGVRVLVCTNHSPDLPESRPRKPPSGLMPAPSSLYRFARTPSRQTVTSEANRSLPVKDILIRHSLASSAGVLEGRLIRVSTKKSSIAPSARSKSSRGRTGARKPPYSRFIAGEVGRLANALHLPHLTAGDLPVAVLSPGRFVFDAPLLQNCRRSAAEWRRGTEHALEPDAAAALAAERRHHSRARPGQSPAAGESENRSFGFLPAVEPLLGFATGAKGAVLRAELLARLPRGLPLDRADFVLLCAPDGAAAALRDGPRRESGTRARTGPLPGFEQQGGGGGPEGQAVAVELLRGELSGRVARFAAAWYSLPDAAWFSHLRELNSGDWNRLQDFLVRRLHAAGLNVHHLGSIYRGAPRSKAGSPVHQCLAVEIAARGFRSVVLSQWKQRLRKHRRTNANASTESLDSTMRDTAASCFDLLVRKSAASKSFWIDEISPAVAARFNVNDIHFALIPKLPLFHRASRLTGAVFPPRTLLDLLRSPAQPLSSCAALLPVIKYLSPPSAACHATAATTHGVRTVRVACKTVAQALGPRKVVELCDVAVPSRDDVASLVHGCQLKHRAFLVHNGPI